MRGAALKLDAQRCFCCGAPPRVLIHRSSSVLTAFLHLLYHTPLPFRVDEAHHGVDRRRAPEVQRELRTPGDQHPREGGCHCLRGKDAQAVRVHAERDGSRRRGSRVNATTKYITHAVARAACRSTINPPSPLLSLSLS